MDPKHILAIVLIVQLASINVFALNEYFYEFGSSHLGETIYTKEGTIFPVLSYTNYIDIPVARDEEITYVSVRVEAINPPKVDFDSLTKTVAIKFSFLQLTYSKYKIFVKGIKGIGSK